MEHSQFFHLEGKEYDDAHDKWNKERLKKFQIENDFGIKFVNYTPHEINLVTSLGLSISFESKGSARVKETQVLVKREKPGIELRRVIYGGIEGLPEEKEDQIVIVSLLVKQANALSSNPRKDLVSPDTGASCIRENGQIKAVTGFLV